MTKKSFENLEDKYVYCECCKKFLPKENFNYSYVRKNYTALRCKVCDWFKRHNIVYDNNNVEHMVIKSLILNNYNYLNELSDKYKMRLDIVIDIVRKYKIGNRHLLILVNCTNCNKEFDVVLSAYKNSNNLFCCNDCYYDYKKRVSKTGEENPQYNRIETKCSNCGKDIKVIPFDFNKKNVYGDNHNFCSKECYWSFRSKYYVQDKNCNYKKEMSEAQKEKIRKNLLTSLNNKNRLDTKIQLDINKILKKNKINFIREYICGYYSIDNYLTDYNLVIEVMGDYWHSSPIKYNKEKYLLNEMQYKGIQKDKQKHTYILKYMGIEILYLWETDIKNNIEKCECLIKEYIKNSGKLLNYNSFNYSFENGGLSLNSHIITPYIYRSSSDIKSITKKFM